jgi:DNA replication protein DnaC
MTAPEYDWDKLDAREHARAQAERDQRDADHREAQRALIPTRFRNAKLTNAAARAWCDDPQPDRPALYLSGPTGTGKTHIAWAVVRRIAETRSWQFWRSTALLDQLRPDAENVMARIHQAQTTGLLVIDDIGAEKPSAWTQERFYELIDERYVWCRPLVITSNRPPQELGSAVSERVASRLAEMSLVVPVLGTDRRKR